MNKLHIIIDPGHGIETKGKRSPDSRLLEYKWNREFSDMLSKRLTELNISNEILVPDEKDMSLANRCLNANTISQKNAVKGYDNIYISIHVNAAKSDGQWHNATGATAWIYTKASAKSKCLGQLYAAEAKNMKITGNRCLPAVGYYTANYYVLKNTQMPAILLEHMFMDNKEDVDYLLSDKGKKEMLLWHENSILNYMKKYNYS